MSASYITELRKCRTLVGSSCCSGFIGPPGPGIAPLYGSFVSNTTQQTVGINANPNSKPITYSSRTVGTIDVVGGTYPNSQILIPVTGVYRILFSAQIDSTLGLLPLEIFPVKNSSSIPDSNTRSVVDTAIETCLTVEYFLSFDAGDKFELRMTGGSSGSASNAQIVAFAAIPGINGPTIPAIPSIILTIQRIE